MKTCVCCQQEAETGMYCRRCNAVLCVMAIVKRHWSIDEMERLRDTLREGGTAKMHEDAKARGAVVMAKLLRHVIDMAKAAKLDPEVLKSKICDAINEEIAANSYAQRFEAKHGEGSYLTAFIAKLGEVWSAITGKQRATTEQKEAA